MVDHRALQRGVALLQCGQEQGSAAIVAPTIAIATRHSVIDHLENPQVPIELRLSSFPDPIIATLHAVTFPVEDDMVLLQLGRTVEESDVVGLSANHLPVGVEWQGFGFPGSRSRAGAWISGAVANWLPQGGGPQDVELSVTDFQSFKSYRGFSGGPVWVGGRAVAFLQRQLDGALAATSVLRLRRQLDAAGIRYRSAESNRSVPGALRRLVGEARPNTQTYWALENALSSPTPGYTVLTGVPGAGKTVIAAGFTPSDPRKRVVGTYFAGGDGDPAGLPPEHHRDPGAFASWLAQETALVTGEGAPSLASHGIRDHAAGVVKNLVALGLHFQNHGSLGVLVIDDFCGFIGGSIDAGLGRVLPSTPPPGLAIALTSANEDVVRAAAPHLALASVVGVVPLELYDSERIVAASLGEAVQSSDILRIAAAADGNPLILSYLVREAQNALSAGSPLPPTGSAVPTAHAFYEQQWARLSGSDAGLWLVAMVARLRGPMPESELVPILPDAMQVGLPGARRAVGHFMREGELGIEVFHSSFREFVLAKTTALDQSIHDRLAARCASASSRYAVANVVYHHFRGSAATKQLAAGKCTQEWLDEAAIQCTPPAYLLADLEDLLRAALTIGALDETIRLLLVRSRLRFRYGTILGEYAFELASVIAKLRGAATALRFVVQDGQLLCAPHEAVAFIRRLILAEEYEIACEVYQALRRVCFARYQTRDVTLMSSHLEALGLLLGELGPKRMGEMRLLYRILDDAVLEDGQDAALFKTRVSALPAAGQLWRWGWFVHAVRYRESDPGRYAVELSSVLDHAHDVTRVDGPCSQKLEPPPSNDRFEVLSADEAAAEIEACCRRAPVDVAEAPSTIAVLMRHARDARVVAELAATLASPPILQVRKPNGVDVDHAALNALFQWNAIASYVEDAAVRERVATRVREPWERRFIDAFSWLGATYGRLCRERRASQPVSLDLEAELLPLLTFTLAERSTWQDSYALPEGMVPLLFARLCEVLVEFAPHLAASVSTWALDRLHEQLGLYTEGCRRSLWELAEGFALCDVNVARGMWRAHLGHVLSCTANRSERVPALLFGARGGVDSGDSELAEECFAHAIRSSAGPSWYKEDQFTLLVDALEAANDPALTAEYWREVATLLERASGDVTFQRYVRYEKESLVGHLAVSDLVAEGLALATNYLWPDEQTQLGRIQSWRADHVTPIDAGRWGVMEIDPQAAALALLKGLNGAPSRYRWAILELFLPGDDRHLSSYAKLVSGFLEGDDAEWAKRRLLQVLVTDFAPNKRGLFVRHLRELGKVSTTQWVQEIEGEYTWARDHARNETAAQVPLVGPLLDEGASPSREDGGGALNVPEGERTAEDASADAIYLPGLFGRADGRRALEEAVANADARRATGNLSGARETYVEGLAAAQSAGWGIWNADSDCRAALRGVFAEPGDPTSAVRAMRNLVLQEEYAVDWRVAGALMELGVPGRPAHLVMRVVDEVFAHARAILAPEMERDVDYELGSLAERPRPENPRQAIVLFLLSALDDPSGHFRERAASIVRWLLVSDAAFDLDLVLGRALSALGRHSREICLGMLHSWVVADPAAATVAITSRPEFARLESDPSFAARYVALEIRRRGGGGVQESSRAEGPTLLHDAESAPQPAPPSERPHLWRDDCEEILRIAGKGARDVAARHLADVCVPLSPSDAIGLWRVRRGAVASDDFWSSACEREAVWRAVGELDDDRSRQLADQLMWNPQWPDATLQAGHAGLCERIFDAVRNGRFEDCFVVDDRLLLHCREAMFDENEQAASQLEIVALLVPSAYFTGEFDRELLYERRSTHGTTAPRASIVAMPVDPAVAKFADRRGSIGGSMTPAVPSRRFLELTRAPDGSFFRASWRSGREWVPVGVGRPVHDGTLLAIDARVSLQLSGMDLVWCFLRDGRRVALVDPARRRVLGGEDL